jgi:hypothetical protein
MVGVRVMGEMQNANVNQTLDKAVSALSANLESRWNGARLH